MLLVPYQYFWGIDTFSLHEQKILKASSVCSSGTIFLVSAVICLHTNLAVFNLHFKKNLSCHEKHYKIRLLHDVKLYLLFHTE